MNEVVPHDKMEETVQDIAHLLLTSGPEAIAACKELIDKTTRMNFEEVKKFTAEMIANLRISPEGQEGMAAFLEKRKPKWLKK